MRIRTKLIILCAGISVSITGLLGVVLSTRLRTERLAFIGKSISQHLDVISFAFAGFIEEAEGDLSALAANELVRTQDDRDFTSFLEADEKTFVYHYGQTERKIIDIFNTHRLTHRYVNSVYMGRENGSFVRSHPRLQPTRYDPRERPWYGAATAVPGTVVVTDAYPSLTTNDVNIGIVKALVDLEGRLYGVVGLDVTLANLTEYLGRFSAASAAEFLLVDGKGTVLASREPTLRSLGVEAVSPALAGLLAGSREGSATLSVRGEQQLVLFRPPMPEGWRSARATRSGASRIRTTA